MKKRVGGAIVLVAVGIGIWLNSLFTGIGPGGEGTNVGLSPDLAVNVETSEKPMESTASDQPSNVSIPAGSVPTILIDDRQYLLQLGDSIEESFQPIEISEVVRLAKEAQPGQDGIRLHIKRRETSRASAESALTDALREAGVPDNAIQMHAGFVE